MQVLAKMFQKPRQQLANMKHPVPNKQAEFFLKWIPPAVIFNMPYAVKRMMDSPNISSSPSYNVKP